MNKIDLIFSRFFKSFQPLPAGVYHYQSPAEIEKPYRLHLRLEADGTGILILNAHTVLHLNQTASEYCYHLVKETPKPEAVRQISNRYRISRAEVESDFDELHDRIQALISTPDVDPVTYLGFERKDPYSAPLSAPYRLDCALTYRTSAGDEKDTPVERVKRELSTDEWKTVLTKAWEAGIPHVIFTGGEPTCREDLSELIACTQQLGQVSGLLTDGLRLADAPYLNILLEKGLDHMMLVLDPTLEQGWKAVAAVLAADIHLTVHLTVQTTLVSDWLAAVDRLADMGVTSLSLSASAPQYQITLMATSQKASERGLTLVWDLPVPYSHLNPVAIEHEMDNEEQLPNGAGTARLYVEPDGDVLPSQGMADQVMGNLLNDTWKTIWDKSDKA